MTTAFTVLLAYWLAAAIWVLLRDRVGKIDLQNETPAGIIFGCIGLGTIWAMLTVPVIVLLMIVLGMFL